MIPTSGYLEVGTDGGSSEPADYKAKKLLGDGISCALSSFMGSSNPLTPMLETLGTQG